EKSMMMRLLRPSSCNVSSISSSKRRTPMTMRKTRNALIYLAIFGVACGATVSALSTTRGNNLIAQIEAQLPWTEPHVLGLLLAADPCPADEANNYDCWDHYYQKL